MTGGYFSDWLRWRQFDQLFGVGKASNRGLSRVENVDGLIWDVKCLHKGRCGKSEVLVSHEVEMASWETFAFSLSDVDN